MDRDEWGDPIDPDVPGSWDDDGADEVYTKQLREGRDRQRAKERLAKERAEHDAWAPLASEDDGLGLDLQEFAEVVDLRQAPPAVEAELLKRIPGGPEADEGTKDPKVSVPLLAAYGVVFHRVRSELLDADLEDPLDVETSLAHASHWCDVADRCFLMSPVPAERIADIYAEVGRTLASVSEDRCLAQARFKLERARYVLAEHCKSEQPKRWRCELSLARVLLRGDARSGLAKGEQGRGWLKLFAPALSALRDQVPGEELLDLAAEFCETLKGLEPDPAAVRQVLAWLPQALEAAAEADAANEDGPQLALEWRAAASATALQIARFDAPAGLATALRLAGQAADIDEADLDTADALEVFVQVALANRRFGDAASAWDRALEIREQEGAEEPVLASMRQTLAALQQLGEQQQGEQQQG